MTLGEGSAGVGMPVGKQAGTDWVDGGLDGSTAGAIQVSRLEVRTPG